MRYYLFMEPTHHTHSVFLAYQHVSIPWGALIWSAVYLPKVNVATVGVAEQTSTRLLRRHEPRSPPGADSLTEKGRAKTIEGTLRTTTNCRSCTQVTSSSLESWLRMPLGSLGWMHRLDHRETQSGSCHKKGKNNGLAPR